MKRSIAYIALVFVFVLLLGCSRKNNTQIARDQGILLMGNGPEPASLDPQITSGTSELNIQLSLFEGLVTPDPSTLEATPGVAEKWTVSNDGLQWTFYLRETARWSDGNPVVAKDFVEAYRRVLNPSLAAPYASMFSIIAGASNFNNGISNDPAQIGVHALDERTLEIRLLRPIPHLLSILMHPVFGPIPHHLYEGVASSMERSGDWTTLDKFVGNGPFRLSEWKPNQYIEVVKSETYWDSEAVQLKGIRFFVYDEAGAEERAFLGNQLHVTDSLPPARVAAYQGDGDERLRIDSYLGTYYILLNHKIAPLNDKRVRYALAKAIDKEKITKQLLGAGQSVANGFVPDSMPGYDSVEGLKFDPEEASRLLEEAGFPGGEGFPQLTYLFNSSESHRLIGEALAGMWRSHLGIEIDLENVEWRTYLQRRETGDFEIARAVWIGDYAEPSSFLNLWSHGLGNEWAGWKNSGYDYKMSVAIDEADNSIRNEKYALAEKVLLEEQPFIPLYHYVTVYLKVPYLKGWEANLLDWHPYKHLYFADQGERL